MSRLGSLYIKMGEPEGEITGCCDLSEWAAGVIEDMQAQAAVEPVNEFFIGVCESLDEGKKIDAMRLALEALNNSVDLVWEEYTEAERNYGNYPTRRAKLDGMKAMAQQHTDAIAALEKEIGE